MPLCKDKRIVGLAAVCGVVFALDLTTWHKSIHGVGPGMATVLANFIVGTIKA